MVNFCILSSYQRVYITKCDHDASISLTTTMFTIIVHLISIELLSILFPHMKSIHPAKTYIHIITSRLRSQFQFVDVHFISA